MILMWGNLNLYICHILIILYIWRWDWPKFIIIS